MDWDSRPQRDRRNRNSSSEESTSNSSSDRVAPCYGNDNSNLSMEELYEEDEMYFNAAGVYLDRSEDVSLEEEVPDNLDLDSIDIDELDAEDEMYFNAASSQPV